MVGLSVVLEAHHLKNAANPTTKKTGLPLVISKATMVKPPPETHPSSARSFLYPPVGGGFLDACFLCRQKLLPGKDIYMYKGDKAFCSEECRLKQMLMDEYDEDNTNKYNNNSMKLLERPPYYKKYCSSSTASAATRPRRWNPFNGVRTRRDGFTE